MVMSVVSHPVDRSEGSLGFGETSVRGEAGARDGNVTPMRYRGWVLVGLGLGSWAGLLTICRLF